MNDIERLTAWHRAQLGTRERGENNVRYNTDYYGREVSGSAFPWCAAYIWDGFRECGLSELYLGGGQSAYCPYIVGFARNAGKWVTDGFREGDILLYDFEPDGIADHIGYCLGWDGLTATAIEGNYGDAVQTVSRRKSQIMGAYRPDYNVQYIPLGLPEEENDGDQAAVCGGAVVLPDGGHADGGAIAGKPALPEISEGCTGDAVRLWQRLLMGFGYDFPQYGDDGDFGFETKITTKCWQYDHGLEVDGIVGEKSWRSVSDALKEKGEGHGTD